MVCRRIRPESRAGILPWLLGVLLALPGLVQAMEPTPLQAEFATILDSMKSLRSASPLLADALEGRLSQERRREAEAAFLALPIENRVILALGNGAVGALAERTTPGSGTAYLREGARLAGDDLGLHWFLCLSQMRGGSPAGFRVQTDEMVRAMLAHGWQRLPEASSWLLELARDNEKRGQREMAMVAREAAVELDPSSPTPRWNSAAHYLASADFKGAYSHLSDGVQRLILHPINQQFVVFNLLRLVRYTVGLAFFLLLLTWLVRYWPWIAHLTAEKLPRDTSIYLRYIVLACFLACLWIAGLGPLSLSFIVVALLWKRARRYERFLMGIWIALLGLLPFIAGFEIVLAERFDRHGAEALYTQSVQQGFSPSLESRLRQGLNDAADNDRALFATSLSILSKKRGDFTNARGFAEEAVHLAPDDPRTLINLGNMQYLAGHFDTARSLFERSRAIDADNTVLPFNLSQVAASQSQTGRVMDIYRGSSSAARYRFAVMAQQNSLFPVLPPARSVIDPELSPETTWRQLLDDFLNGNWKARAGDIRTGLLDIPVGLLPLLSIVFLGGLIWWGSRPVVRRELFACKTCGKVMCFSCRKGIHCQVCFRRLSGVEEIELRNEMLDRIEKEKMTRELALERGLDMLLPGVGRLMARPSIGAFLHVILLAFALNYALNLPNLLSEYPSTYTSAGRFLALGLLAGLYAWSAFQLVRSANQLGPAAQARK